MFGLENMDLSRIQFAYTLGVHFIFLPLTLGLSFLMAIMETIYVRTGKEIYKQMVKFWGVLFSINFAMAVATGLAMKFQFGTNWSYYANYVGDVFVSPFAIEGLMVFFLEATFIALFFFGWDKLTKVQHSVVTWLVFIGSNILGFCIFVANGWIQNPVGHYFNLDTMSIEINDFSAVILNPATQYRFLHTLTASYITGAIFVMAVSSYYLLRKRNIEFARRSMIIATVVGLLSTLATVYMGYEQGKLVNETQPAKMAAIDGSWATEPYPAGFIVFAVLSKEEQINYYEVKIPQVLGLLYGEKIKGIKEVIADNKLRIKSGLIAYDALQQYKEDKNNTQAKDLFEKHVGDLGYALLLFRNLQDISKATDQDIAFVAENSIPKVATLFYSFRIILALVGLFLLYFFIAYVMVIKNTYIESKFMQRASMLILPLPWVAIFLGLVVSEYGRQWVIQDSLPTFKASSILSSGTVVSSLIGFFIIYTSLIIIDAILMIKQIKKGPEDIRE